MTALQKTTGVALLLFSFMGCGHKETPVASRQPEPSNALVQTAEQGAATINQAETLAAEANARTAEQEQQAQHADELKDPQ